MTNARHHQFPSMTTTWEQVPAGGWHLDAERSTFTAERTGSAWTLTVYRKERVGTTKVLAERVPSLKAAKAKAADYVRLGLA